MKILNLKPFKVIAQALVMGLLLMACENNSSGSKDTMQEGNDNDPTNIENQTDQDTDNNTTMGTDRNTGSMNNTGENSNNLDRNNSGSNAGNTDNSGANVGSTGAISGNERTGMSGNMDTNSDIVVIQNFDDKKWQKFRTDRNFQTGDNVSFNDITSRNIGAESWKTWQNKQYRIVYYTDNGALKARPIVKTDDNKEVQLTSQTVQSMSLQGLWDEVQKEVSGLKGRY
jgi:hypothetical protein